MGVQQLLLTLAILTETEGDPSTTVCCNALLTGVSRRCSRRLALGVPTHDSAGRFLRNSTN